MRLSIVTMFLSAMLAISIAQLLGDWNLPDPNGFASQNDGRSNLGPGDLFPVQSPESDPSQMASDDVNIPADYQIASTDGFSVNPSAKEPPTQCFDDSAQKRGNPMKKRGDVICLPSPKPQPPGKKVEPALEPIPPDGLGCPEGKKPFCCTGEYIDAWHARGDCAICTFPLFHRQQKQLQSDVPTGVSDPMLSDINPKSCAARNGRVYCCLFTAFVKVWHLLFLLGQIKKAL